MIFHHIGIAVFSLETGARHVRDFYAGNVVRETGPVHDPMQEADLQLFELKDGSRIEIVAGQPATSTLAKGFTLHHVCYEVGSVADTVQEWYARGAVIVSPPKPAVLFDGRLVAFVLTPLGLVEFLNDE